MTRSGGEAEPPPSAPTGETRESTSDLDGTAIRSIALGVSVYLLLLYGGVFLLNLAAWVLELNGPEWGHIWEHVLYFGTGGLVALAAALAAGWTCAQFTKSIPAAALLAGLLEAGAFFLIGSNMAHLGLLTALGEPLWPMGNWVLLPALLLNIPGVLLGFGSRGGLRSALRKLYGQLLGRGRTNPAPGNFRGGS